MKKIVLLTGFAVLTAIAFSQKKLIEAKEITGRNCGTMLQVENYFKKNPQAKVLAEQMARMVPTGPAVMNYRTNSIVTIPVVVHIVLNNPNVVTDADVQWQIDRLNLDYSGLNPDSTNEPPEFIAVRGHSQIRFTLARRTPTGQLTNGIERIQSSSGSNINQSTDPIKRSSLGGADVWDPTSYLNIWVGNDMSGNGILGYAQFPGMSTPANDGVFINVRSWSNNPCYTIAAFNMGRTAVHEVGHYFGLLHNWGDDGTACTGDDFQNLTAEGSSCSLPAGLFNPVGQGNTSSDIGDTPNQAGSNSGLCPSGIKTDACTTTSPGIMYQDFMDYTNDACYSLFTKKQVERMEWCLDNCRSSLKTSLGATVPSGAVTLDASPYQSVNPGGSEVTGCTNISYVSALTCPGSIAPKVRIRNNGLNTLNNVTVGLIVDGGAPVTQTISPNLPFGYTTVVSFASINFATGTHTLKFFTSNPNGVQPDQVPSNDTLTTTLTVSAPVSLPITEGFEGSTFPPAGWSIYNPNADFTWVRVTPGHNSNYSAAIDNYNNDGQGRIDELRTPKLTFPPADSIINISFDVAHKNFPDATNYDTLSVLVSNDCGATWTTVYKKYGPQLASDTLSDAYITPANGDWRKETITINGALTSAGNIIVAFRNTNRFGNNIFLDNINIAPQGPGDLRLVSVNQPAAIICSSTVTPSVTVQNLGTQAIGSFDASYSIDNGPITTTNFTGLNITTSQQITVSLTPITTTTGTHTIKVFISNAVSVFGARDNNTANDSLTITFALVGRMSVPITEVFESTTFPPVNWAVDNPDNSVTWQRTTSAAKTGAASMVIRNFDYPANNTVDRFASPIITNISSYDSLLVSFDLAYSARNTTGPFDTLEVQLTNACGRTISTVWKQWGTQLQTTTNTSSGRFVPTANDWKNIRVLLSPITTPTTQIYFVAKGNGQNNLYIDNINIYGLVLPQLLKTKGYDIYPNPFNSSFIIHHLLPPTNLQSIKIFNAFGQIVWQQQLNGQGSGQIPVNLSNVAPGVYFIKLIYTERTITEKIIKN